MKSHVTRVIVSVLLLAGCSIQNPSIVSQQMQLKQGEVLQNFRLIRITADGKAEFHNIDAGEDTKVFPHFTVGVGESFGEETQSHRRTGHDFTVEHTDPVKQEATVLVRITEY